ncbi:hypothetical protein ACIBKX_33730 [Streptomyces sp. NPDC050658]|uniref:AMIN-like domain-containing (lipo)protein n=1 Tax=unclassified Streptomyces TaxID=2593676 RepID=UPI00343C41FD
MTWKKTAALAAGTVVLAGAVAAPAKASEVTTAQAAACPIAWGSLAETRALSTLNPLTNVRTGQHGCWDRVVIDVPKAAVGELGYYVRYVDKFAMDGSGEVVPVSGGAIIQVSVHAPAYNVSTGATTYPATAGKKLPGVDLAGYRTLRDARYGGTFEGMTQIGLGVREKLPFRVSVLNGRIVIDVAHNWTGTPWQPKPESKAYAQWGLLQPRQLARL